jgi:hypothetical protein
MEDQDADYSKTYCEVGYGGTFIYPAPWIVICFDGWEHKRGETENQWTYSPIGSNDPRPIAPWLVEDFQDQRPGRTVDSVRRQFTSCGTLFHELFHLVLGLGKGKSRPLDDDEPPLKPGEYRLNMNVPPDAQNVDFEDELYSLDCMNLRADDMASNVQNFVYVAFAYDATRRIPPVGGFLVEYNTGAALRWEELPAPAPTQSS